jgi:hypothetical protein
MAEGGDIIIRGGSVQLDFNDDYYPEGKGRLNEKQKITRIQITGDVKYDSDDHPEGLRCNITVTCKTA